MQLPGSATLTMALFLGLSFIMISRLRLSSSVSLRALVLSWPRFSCPFVLGGTME